MHFNSFPVLTGTPEDFEKECAKLSVTGKSILHPKEFYGGAALIPKDKEDAE